MKGSGVLFRPYFEGVFFEDPLLGTYDSWKKSVAFSFMRFGVGP